MNWRLPVTKKDFISGYFYHKLCHWILCPRYTQIFDITKLKNNDLVFLNLDYFESLVNYLNSNIINNKFVLVTQNSDRDFTKEMFEQIDKYVSKVFAINCDFQDAKVIKIPLGFNDHSTEELENQSFDFIEKKNLIYMNFKLHHHIDRPICFDYFNQFEWVTVENQILPLNEFYSKLKNFKYCLCPRGTGIDTHRVYESLLFGVIPIVKKSTLDDLYQKLPVILVENWSDVTQEFLNSSYESALSKLFDWQEKNPDWFKSEYWIKK